MNIKESIGENLEKLTVYTRKQEAILETQVEMTRLGWTTVAIAFDSQKNLHSIQFIRKVRSNV